MGVIITANRKKNVNIHFMVDDKEFDLIKQGMKESGIKSMRAYLLKMAVNGQIIHVELDSVREMVRLLSNAANNINQIANRVNATSNIYAADIDDLRGNYDALRGQSKEILRLLSDISDVV